MSDVAVQVRVVGHVQGVGFRWSCQQAAERLCVAGWVRNEPDDSVAGHFEGTAGAVDALVAWCRSGSSGADVDRVDVDEAEPTGTSGFEIRS